MGLGRKVWRIISRVKPVWGGSKPIRVPKKKRRSQGFHNTYIACHIESDASKGHYVAIPSKTFGSLRVPLTESQMAELAASAHENPPRVDVTVYRDGRNVVVHDHYTRRKLAEFPDYKKLRKPGAKPYPGKIQGHGFAPPQSL